MSRLDWHDDAYCFGATVDLFFPHGNGGTTRALDVIDDWCVPCPVRAQCLADEAAQITTARNGIRGGVLWRYGGDTFDPHQFLSPEEA